MSNAFRSIFARRRRVVLPERETPLMRVLEPRVLLDAAALETALDVASQAVHSDLAEAYLSPEAQARPAADRTPFAVHRSAAFDGLNAFVQQDDVEEGVERDTDDPVRREIVFIDGSLPERDTLLAAVDPAAEVHVIESDMDGLAFIAATLDGERNVDAIHILSHGSSGSLSLGAAVLDGSTLSGSAVELAAIRAALSDDADLLIYGCNFGAGEEGRRVATALALATGADIAASDDLTGSAALGGDWDLELRVGEIESRAMRTDGFNSVLADEYAIEVSTPPVITHPSGQPIGTLETVVRYPDAVIFTPEGGGATETYDLVGQFVGFTGDVTVAFSGEGNDLGITVNNLGTLDPVTGLYPPGAVSINWFIVDPGSLAPPPAATIDLTVDGLYGADGVADTGTGVSVDLSIVSAYTLDPASHLTEQLIPGDGDSTLEFFGTQPADATGDTDQVSISWGNASDLLMSFHTREQSTLFVVDGNRETTFTNGQTTLTRLVDANGSAPGVDYAVVYENAGSNSGDEAGVAIVDIDAVVYDIDNVAIERLEVRLDGARPGDQLVYDAAVAATLGIDVFVDTTPPDIVLTAETLDFNNGTLTRSFRDFLASIAYRNDLPDGSFDRTTPRTITMTFSDGIDEAPPATTTVTFTEAAGAVTVTPILEAAPEDQSIIRNAATGVLSGVANPAGNPLTVGSASIGGVNVPLGTSYTNGDGTFRLNADGSFRFDPAANTSGTVLVDIVINAGAGGTVATSLMLNVTSDPDVPTLSLTLPTGPTNEDAPTAALNVVAAPSDPSERFEVRIVNLPEGAIIEDQAGNSHRSDPDNEAFIDVTGWTLADLRVLPLEDSDAEITFEVVARSTEDDGRFAEVSQEVTFQIDAVADAPEVIAQSAVAPVDGTVELFRFINVNLRDTDGSETIGLVRITGIENDGVSFFIGGTPRAVDYSSGPNDGVLVLTMAELSGLTMQGPNDGQQHAYRYFVFAEAIETNPNGNVSLVTAVEGPVALNIALDSSDDPVIALPDSYTAAAGQTSTLDISDNDTALDGGLEVFQINGTAITSTSEYTLPNGAGTLRLDGSGGVTFQASADYSGTFVFEYTIRDFDGDEDTAQVVLTVEPIWNISAVDPTAAEGGSLDFSISLAGSLRPGERASVTPGILYGTALPADIDDLDAAITAAVATDPNFSFDGTTITFEAPLAAYDVTTEVGGTFVDITTNGTALNVASGSAVLSLPYPFTFNGRDVSTIAVMADGLISPDGPLAPTTNGPLDGNAFGGDAVIAPWWDTIDTSTGSVTTLTEGEVGARITIVQWTGTPAAGTETVTFQAVLHEANGDIEFRYLDVAAGGAATSGGSATIGLQGDGIGTQFSNNTTSVNNGMSVRFEAPTIVEPTLDVQLGIVDDTDFETSETLTLQIAAATDSRIGTASLLATIDFSDNSAPIATDDTASTTKDRAVVIDVLGGATPGSTADSDPEGQPLTLASVEGIALLSGDSVTLASGAVVTLQTDGTLSYDPSGQFDGLLAGQNAPDSFDYTIFDGLDGYATATVTLDVQGVNVPPTIELDGVDGGGTGVSLLYVDTQSRVAVAPTATVNDIEGDAFDTLNIALSGFIQGADEEIIVGNATIQYGVALTTSITVGSNNFDLVYDGVGDVTVTGPGGATFDDAAMEELLQSVTYDNTAGNDLAGVRTLAFTAEAGGGVSAIATASIDVEGSNAAPDAVDDGSVATPFLTGTEDNAIAIDPTTLLTNDSDPEGDAFSIIGYGNEVGGRIVIDAMGAVSFVPDADHSGTATFDYTVRDTFNGTSTATVTLEFDAVNDAPTIDLNPDPAETDVTSSYVEDGPATPIIPVDAVFGDVDDTNFEIATITFNGAPGDRLNVATIAGGITVSASPPQLLTGGLSAGGRVTLVLSGSAAQVDYAATLGSITFDTTSDSPSAVDRTFEIQIGDGELPSATARNVMSVAATNDDPVAVNDGPFTVAEDGELRIAIATLLQNDYDPDGPRPTFDSLVDATNGTVTRDGAFVVFNPTPDASGPASFRYLATDGVAASVQAEVSINITPVNDAPVLDADGTTPAVDGVINLSFDEDAAPIALVDADFALTDIDDINIDVAVVILRNGQPGDVLSYGATPAGTTATLSPSGPLGNAAQQTLTLVGSASVADYRDWLATVSFQNQSQAPSTVLREITMQVGDGSLPSNVLTANVTVIPSNDAPVTAADPVQQTNEDTDLVILPSSLLSNDSDPDGETPIFDSVDNAVGGTVTIDGTGRVVFTPDADTFGPASFDYTIRDGDGETATQTVDVQVNPVNDAPIIVHGASPAALTTAYTEGDAPVALVTGFAISDVDDTQIASVEVHLTNGAAGDVIAMTGSVAGINVNAPGPLANNGPLFVTLTGPASIADFEAAVAALTFASTSDFPSETRREVLIRVSDGSAISDPVMVRIDVTEVNDLPDVPMLSPFPTNEDTPVAIPFATLTGGPTDRDGDALVVSAILAEVGGRAVISGNVVTFTPDADYTGPASFEYEIDDGRSGTITHTATIAINPIDDAPVATVGSGTSGPYVENGVPISLLDPALTITDVDSASLDSALVQIGGQAGDVVTHDALPAGIIVQISPATPLTRAGAIVVTITGNGSADDYADALRALRFASASEYPSETPRSIQFAVQDQTSASNIVFSTLTVQAVNDVPVAMADPQLDAVEDTPLRITAAQLLADVSDADLDPLTITGTSNVVGGTISAGPGSSLIFTPDADFDAVGGFDYTVSDGNGGTVTAHADVNVQAVDDAPTLDLSASLAGADYAFTYTEDDGATPVVGSDILVEDVDTAQLVAATITLVNGHVGDVLNVGTLPSAISMSIVPSGPLTAPGPITIYLTGPEIPSVYGFALGAITYSSVSQSPSEVPRLVQMTVSDGNSNSDLATSQINVVSVNDVPVANDDGLTPVLTTLEDTSIDFSPIANDTDVDGDPLRVTAVAGTPVVAGGTVAVPDGRVTLLGDGTTLRFEPNANLFGSVTFQYTVFDGQASDVADITIEVVSVNDLPALGADAPVALDEDTSASFDPTANDSDADGDPLNIASIDGQPMSPGGSVVLPEGELRVGIDGRTITFTPVLNWNGVLTVPYEVSDGVGGIVAAELVFDVAPVNDPLQVVATPPAVTYNDGSMVSIAMDTYLTDPDGDPISYTVTGLPAGLTIDPRTALISGRLESDASATSPYFVTVTGDDGMGSQVGVSFQLTAVNTVPVGAADPTVPVADGDIITYSGADLFTDADGDTLAFTALGLPAWLQIDAATGEVYGVVPFDASQGGPVTFAVTATDHAGAADTVNVTFVATNPAPAVVRSLGFMIADEGQDVRRDLTRFIADGGRDADVLTWTVTGLPDGVTFDPATAIISGVPADGTRSLTGYEIEITVDDGEGGVLVTSFTFFVGDVSNPTDDFDIETLPDTPTAPKTAATISPLPFGFDGDRPDRSGTVQLDRSSGVIVASVAGIEDLQSIDDVAFELDGFDQRIRADLRGEAAPRSYGAGIIESVRNDRPVDYTQDADGNISADLGIAVDNAVPLVIEVPDVFEAPVAATAASSPVEVAARVAPGRVFVSVRTPDVSVDPIRPISVAPRGVMETVTQKVIRNGLVSFGVPSGLLDLSLTVATELADDVLSVIDVDVDVKTGSVKIIGPDDVRGAAPQRSPLPEYPPIL